MKIIINEEYELLNLSLTSTLTQLELFEKLGYKLAEYKGKKQDLIDESNWVHERIITIGCLRKLTEKLIINGLYRNHDFSTVCERLSSVLTELDKVKQIYFRPSTHLEMAILIEKIEYGIFRLCPILMNTELSRA